MNTATFALFLVLGIALIAAIFTLVSSYLTRKRLSNTVTTRGANGIQGQTITLQCPSGQNISIDVSVDTSIPGGMTRSRYVCTNPTPLGTDGTIIEDGGCDPYLQSQGQSLSNFNPATTIDASKDLYQACNGKGTCSFVIPGSSDSSVSGVCGGKGCNGHIQLIGNYTCKP